MIFEAPPRIAAMLLDLFLPEPQRETLQGDLVEEYNLIITNLGRGQARRWYRRQVTRSVAPILRANLRRGNWLKTLGAVMAGYFIVVVLVVISDYALAELFSGPTPLYAILSLVSGFPVLVAGGYFVARIRSRAVSTFAVFVTLMGLVSLAVTGDQAPLWYQIALIIMAPVASLLGARLFVRNKTSRSKDDPF